MLRVPYPVGVYLGKKEGEEGDGDDGDVGEDDGGEGGFAEGDAFGVSDGLGVDPEAPGEGGEEDGEGNEREENKNGGYEKSEEGIEALGKPGIGCGCEKTRYASSGVVAVADNELRGKGYAKPRDEEGEGSLVDG